MPVPHAVLRVYLDQVAELVSPERLAHIQRVVHLTGEIADANGFSPQAREAALLAATLHDAARDLSGEAIFALCAPSNAMERAHPLTLHGKAAAVLARRWGINDPQVLSAIEGHVFGVSDDNQIGMALYIADVSEPGRGVNADIRALAMQDLKAAYHQAVASKVRYLRSRGKPVHPQTLRVHQQMMQAQPPGAGALPC